MVQCGEPAIAHLLLNPAIEFLLSQLLMFFIRFELDLILGSQPHVLKLPRAANGIGLAFERDGSGLVLDRIR